jgi:hypothetical protein
MDDPTGTGPVGGGRRRGPTQAVILAGGRGSRLRPITDVRPKAMVEFHGKPFLAYLVEMLRDQGFERILLLLGYMADAIVNYFEDGHRFGIRIEYSVSAPEDLTARRVELAESKIEEHFLLMYCDNYWPMRIDDMWAQYVASGAPAQITVYSNKDGYSRDSVIVGEGGTAIVPPPACRESRSATPSSRERCWTCCRATRSCSSRRCIPPSPNGTTSTPTGRTTVTTASEATSAFR